MTFRVYHWPDIRNPDLDYSTEHASLGLALDAIDPIISVEWDRAGYSLREGEVCMRVHYDSAQIVIWVECPGGVTDDEPGRRVAGSQYRWLMRENRWME